MISVKQQKEIILGVVLPAFEAEGFAFEDGHAPTFRKVVDGGTAVCFFNFHRDGRSAFSMTLISISEVEHILEQVQYPGFDQTVLGTGAYPYTVQDKINTLNYSSKINPIASEEHARLFASEIAHYVKSQGHTFIQEYTILDNVLHEMNRLTNEGKHWNSILFGLAEYLFRGLIISKLCNDNQYIDKVNMCNSKFSQSPHLYDWIPFYEKLKLHLSQLKA